MYGSSSRSTRHNVLKKQMFSSTEANKQRLIQQFPEVVRLLFTLLGNMETVLQLVGQFGGTTVRVPRRWPPSRKADTAQSHILRTVLTSRQMRIIVQQFGGTELYIPQCTRCMMQMRNRSIIKMFSKDTARGKSSKDVVQKLARRHGISDRRIWDILKTFPIDNENSAEEDVITVDNMLMIPKAALLNDIPHCRQ